jgi:hypothetical protein
MRKEIVVEGCTLQFVSEEYGRCFARLDQTVHRVDVVALERRSSPYCSVETWVGAKVVEGGDVHNLLVEDVGRKSELFVPEEVDECGG